MVPLLNIVTLAAAFQSTYALGPPTIQLRARKPSSHEPSRRRSISSAIDVPLGNYFSKTDLQWYGNIDVGTPSQTLPVIFDTGSSTLEVVSTLCSQNCSNQVKFDPSKSHTYKDGGEENTISFSTGVGVDPIFTPDDFMTLRSAKDDVSIGGFSVPDVEMSLVIEQSSVLNYGFYSGVQGMGSCTQGLFAGLVNQGLLPLFSLYLTPNSVGNAEMTLGGIDGTKFTGDLSYTSLIKENDGYWKVALSDIFVNGKTTASAPKRVIFDSGTSNIYFPKSITESIYADISSEILPNKEVPGTYGIACEKISSLPAEINLSFVSENGHPFNLTIPSTEFNLGPFQNDNTQCHTVINALDAAIIGGSLLNHYYTVWDVGYQRMGFAPRI